MSVYLYLCVSKVFNMCQVGLPAKSGVSGAVLLVVPNVMGIMCWSPPVDKIGNSVRGIHFCQVFLSSSCWFITLFLIPDHTF